MAGTPIRVPSRPTGDAEMSATRRIEDSRATQADGGRGSHRAETQIVDAARREPHHPPRAQRFLTLRMTGGNGFGQGPQLTVKRVADAGRR